MERYRAKPGGGISLQDYDPADLSMFERGKNEGKAALKDLSNQLESLQEILYAEHKQKILVVLQGMDTSGKDGVIRHVFDGVNPQGVKVAGFKKPTQEELDHDYLWRVHKVVPGRGQIVIFNRSHYEDVLVVRVHNLVPETIWQRRYNQIVQFEKMLSEEGVIIIKFFLHISKDKQKERLQARLDISEKRWKFNLGDLKERTLWDEYLTCYEDVLNKTSTEFAPWYIVPSNRKWYRNLVIGKVLVDCLKSLNMSYPEPEEGLDGVVVD